MNTIRLSSTSARNKFFELLNLVALGTQVIIEKDNKEVAVILSKKHKFNWRAFSKSAKAAQGILKDYTIDEVAPLGKKNAWGTFGQWDKK